MALTALNVAAATPRQHQEAPAAILTVDRDDDVSGLACTSADNDCTLRSAIEQANAVGDDYIDFESDMTITLSSLLPELTDDGTTIAPLNPDRVVEIDANGVGGNVFNITGSNIYIEGLRLYGSGDSGPNTLLNYPVITGSSGSTIMGTACLCTVHIYEAVGDPSASGGGGILVDSVATDGTGNWNATLPDGLARLDVTVMAVNTSLNSSEMAPRPQVSLPLILQP